MSVVDGVVRGAMRLGYRALLTWWWLRRPRIEGAYIAVWHDGKLLVIRNSYRTLHSLPAGGLKRGETPPDAAARELREEVGIHVEPALLVHFEEIVDRSSYAEDHAHVFELHCDQAPSFRVDGREVVTAEFLTPEDALARGVVGPVRTYLGRKLACGASPR